MRVTIANVVRHFNIVFGESYNEAKFKKDWKDYAAAEVGFLYLKFIERS
jgi:hypothetical protein